VIDKYKCKTVDTSQVLAQFVCNCKL